MPPSAVNALARVAHNRFVLQDLRVDAIVAFVQMQHPTADAMRVPGDLIHDSNPTIQSAARMMSGALARAGRPEHQTEADAIDASLIALYRDARDMREKSELFGALGNSVGPTVVPVIQEAVGDIRVPVRAAAARALRLAAGSETDHLIAAAITSDHDPAVRADAIFAARFRHPLPAPIADALLQAAGNDAVDYVRSDALAVLRQNPRLRCGFPKPWRELPSSMPISAFDGRPEGPRSSFIRDIRPSLVGDGVQNGEVRRSQSRGLRRRLCSRREGELVPTACGCEQIEL